MRGLTAGEYLIRKILLELALSSFLLLNAVSVFAVTYATVEDVYGVLGDGTNRTGVYNITFKVRSCADSACLGESWSSLYTNATFNDISSLNSNRYFQYQALFYTEYQNYSPMLFNVTIDYIAWDYVPIITLNLPANNSYTNITSSLLNATVYDPELGNMTVWFYGDGVLINTTHNQTNGTTITHNWTSLSEGSHNWTVIAYDGCLNNTAGHRYFIVDLTNPSVTSLAETPGDPATYSFGQIYEFNATVTDANNISAVLLEFNGTNYTASVNGNVYNVSIAGLRANEVGYNYRWYSNDTSGNTNSSETGTYTINKAVPQGSISGTSPITYGTAGNVTGMETNNGDGDVVYTLYRDNVSVSNPDTSVLGAGTYSYVYNATSGQNYTVNTTIGAFNLTVNQAVSSVNLTLNGTLGNVSIAYGATINLNCSILSGDGGATLELYNNGTLINSGTSSLGNSTSFNNSGLHNITCNYLSSQNYSAGSEAWYVNVGLADFDGDGVPDINDTLEGNESHVTTTGIAALDVAVGGNSTYGSFSGMQEVVFYDGAEIIMNFTHNFSAGEIDLRDISITISSTSIVVNLSGQLLSNEKKTLYRADAGFTGLCAKDAEIASAAEISAGCVGANETDFTSCLGNSTGVSIGNLTCYDEGSRVRIDNFSYSGISGAQASAQQSSSSSGGGGSTICHSFCRYAENANLSVCRNNCPSSATQINRPDFPVAASEIKQIEEVEQEEEQAEEQTGSQEVKTEEVKTGILVPQAKFKLPRNLFQYVFFSASALGIMILLIIGAKFNKKDNKQRRSSKHKGK